MDRGAIRFWDCRAAAIGVSKQALLKQPPYRFRNDVPVVIRVRIPRSVTVEHHGIIEPLSPEIVARARRRLLARRNADVPQPTFTRRRIVPRRNL
jgi:hypothetical protein